MDESAPTNSHLILIGLMGTGKSTIGRRIAHKLGWEFFDTDDEVCRVSGSTVREIFELQGEEFFRNLEHRVLADAVAKDGPMVIAAAGGCILRSDNRDLMSLSRHVVWLTASLDVLLERLESRSSKATGHRPLLDENPEEKLRTMFANRNDMYREIATTTVDVGELNVNEVIESIFVATKLEHSS